MTRLTLLAMVKDEQRYIHEWIDHHLNLGIEHIYLVEDYTSSSHIDCVSCYGDKVSVHRCEELGIVNTEYYDTPWRQVWLYDRFITKHEDERKDNTCLFLDIDEFLELREGVTLRMYAEFCKRIHLDARYIILRNFNADYRIFEPDMKQKDAYTKWVYNPNGFHCKSLVNVDTEYRFFCIQRAYCNKNTAFLDQKAETNLAWINHYFTKSWEGWLIRMRRGSQDPNLRKLEQFFDLYNKDMLPYKEYLLNSFHLYEEEWMAGGTRFLPDTYRTDLMSLGYPEELIK